MMQMVEGDPLDYDSSNAIDVINALERTGLRKEICLNNEETYETDYNIYQFLSLSQANEIKENIAFNSQEVVVNDSLKRKWDSVFQAEYERLPPEQKRIEEKIRAKRQEGIKWGSDPNPQGLYHYALLKTDTSFYGYCLVRSMDVSIAITPALTELSYEELENWNIQLLFIVDYYLGNILFRYRRYLN